MKLDTEAVSRAIQDGSLPLFSKVKANIEMFPVMNLEDLQKGLQQIGRGA